MYIYIEQLLLLSRKDTTCAFRAILKLFTFQSEALERARHSRGERMRAQVRVTTIVNPI